MFYNFNYMTFNHMCLVVACVEMSPYWGGQVLGCWSTALDFVQVLFKSFSETSFSFTYILLFAVSASQYIYHICGFAVLRGMECVVFPRGCTCEMSILVLESFAFFAGEVSAFEVKRFHLFGLCPEQEERLFVLRFRGFGWLNLCSDQQIL